MSELVREELIRIAHHYYPVGFPKEWDQLLEAVHEAFPDEEAGEVTQPRMAACLRCCLYKKEPQPDGSQHVTRVAAAVSVLAPVYLVSATTQTVWFRQRSTPSQLFLHPPSEVRPLADTLSRLIEGMLGYRPFPLPLAELALPDLRVSYLKRTPPTLLTALLSDHLENLP